MDIKDHITRNVTIHFGNPQQGEILADEAL